MALYIAMSPNQMKTGIDAEGRPILVFHRADDEINVSRADIEPCTAAHVKGYRCAHCGNTGRQYPTGLWRAADAEAEAIDADLAAKFQASIADTADEPKKPGRPSAAAKALSAMGVE
jgi:hypothetical protein